MPSTDSKSERVYRKCKPCKGQGSCKECQAMPGTPHASWCDASKTTALLREAESALEDIQNGFPNTAIKTLRAAIAAARAAGIKSGE